MSSCSICLSNPIPQSKSITTPCSHTFCNPCLTRWLLMHTSCPICRASLGTDKILASRLGAIGLVRLNQDYLAGLGLNINECFRRVSSLACTILYEEDSLYVWKIIEENFFRTTIRHKDTKFILYVELKKCSCDERYLPIPIWHVWASKQYLFKPKHLKKWQATQKRKLPIKRTNKKCRG